MASLGTAEELRGLAATARLLQCSHVLQLVEAAFIKGDMVTAANVVECSIWASQLGLRSFEAYCACCLAHWWDLVHEEVFDEPPVVGQPLAVALKVMLRQHELLAQIIDSRLAGARKTLDLEWQANRNMDAFKKRFSGC